MILTHLIANLIAPVHAILNSFVTVLNSVRPILREGAIRKAWSVANLGPLADTWSLPYTRPVTDLRPLTRARSVGNSGPLTHSRTVAGSWQCARARTGPTQEFGRRTAGNASSQVATSCCGARAGASCAATARLDIEEVLQLTGCGT